MNNQSNYKRYFDDYIKSVFQIQVHIGFWKQFLNMSIEQYKKDNPENRWISQSGFAIYNIPPDGQNTWLYMSDATFTIEIDDLTGQSSRFFSWVMNMALVRLYNTVEILLLRVIREKHFPHLDDPVDGKKETNKVIAEIKNFLKNRNQNADSKNNRYIIQFLRETTPEIATFLNISVNSANWKTNWKNFFELVSILRNIVTHHSMIVEKNVRNEINSIAGDIFNFYYEGPDANENEDLLRAKSEDLFLNFKNHFNEFSGNIVKFIASGSDLKVIGFRPA